LVAASIGDQLWFYVVSIDQHGDISASEGTSKNNKQT